MKIRLTFEILAQTGETHWGNMYKSILVDVPDTLAFNGITQPVLTTDARIVAYEYEPESEDA